MVGYIQLSLTYIHAGRFRIGGVDGDGCRCSLFPVEVHPLLSLGNSVFIHAGWFQVDGIDDDGYMCSLCPVEVRPL